MSEPITGCDYSPLLNLTADIRLDLYDEWANLAIERSVEKTGEPVYRAGRMVGVTSIRTNDGKEIVLHIRPRFSKLEPLRMLEELAQDELFQSYMAGGQQLFQIFHDKRPVPGPQSGTGETLTAISFIMQLYSLCKRQLKPHMTHTEENLYGKVKGKILFKQHLRRNVLRGQENRVYCRYNLNTVDNIENRILKAALHKARRIVDNFYRHQGGAGHLSSLISYCDNLLREVRLGPVTGRDFAAARTTGFYAYYKPAIAIAKLIILKTYAGVEGDRTTLVTPFAIDMQLLFEMYVYSKLKEAQMELKSTEYAFTLDNAFHEPDENKYETVQNYDTGLHIMRHVIPDYVLTIDAIGIPKKVILDAKYKHSDTQNRLDTHQILAYGLLYHADAIGFIFPDNKEITPDPVNLAVNVAGGGKKPRYVELFLTLTGADGRLGKDNIQSIIEYLTKKLQTIPPA